MPKSDKPEYKQSKNMTFIIEEEYAIKALKWIDEHQCKIRGKYQGAIGGAVSYHFTDTSIGEFQSVNCACGESLLLNGDDF